MPKMEKSCGAVVFTRAAGEVRYVIITSPEGFCGFPKGHMEAGETEQETALREIREETGLEVRLLEGFRTTDSHPLVREGKPEVIKEIVYFLGEFRAQEPRPQQSEVTRLQLLKYPEAMESFQFESSRRILREARDFLQLLFDEK